MNKDKKFSIVQLAPPQDTGLGDYYYRVESPGRALSDLNEVKTVVSITNIHRHKDILMKECDILIINHVCDPDLLPVISHRKKCGLATVFEIGDNINDIQPWNLTCNFWKSEENRNLFYRTVSFCDALQTNNQELLCEFEFLNETTALFPNQMKYVSKQTRKEHKKHIIIGWGGSHGHLDDIKSIVPALTSFVCNHDHIKLAIMGSEEICKLFDKIPVEKMIYRSPGSIKAYYDFLKIIDIGLAPLKDTRYNHCRSDIKFIEYAAYGIVPLLQDLTPYCNHTLPPGTRYLFKNPGELERALDQLTSNASLRKKISKKATEYVRKQRIEKDHADERLNFYVDLLKTSKQTEPNKKNRFIDSFNGYIRYKETEFERNIYNGLIHLEISNQPEKAREMFRNARELMPDNYLPPLFLSQCSENPAAELNEALKKNPFSIKAGMLLGEYYSRTGDLRSALMAYRDLISFFPDYDLPYIKSSEILSSLGMQKEADKLRKIADDMKPGEKKELNRKVPVSAESPVTEKTGQGLYLIMPRGNNYGWGVCGKYLARELSKLSRLMYVTEAFSVEDVGDELDYRLLKSLIASDMDIDELLNPKPSNSDSRAVIQAILGKNLKPWGPNLSIKKKIGYTFFEENILSHKDIEKAKDYFSLVVAGSTWCEDILKKYGLTNTKTIIQGIDPTLFNPHHNQKEYFKDSFVIFSGGKFELRKGQDLVIKAYRHFLERHEDAILIISWNNIWKSTRKSMALSKHIDFIESDEDDAVLFKKLMEMNGIPLSKIIILPPKPNIAMPRIYKNTDIGLFPNRCEGGTNLVLMEYMACGKPAIASFSSGHKDIVNDENSLILRNMGNIEIKQDQNVIAVWDDPDPDEIIEKLEYAYSNSSRMSDIGRTAGEELSCLTWQKTAALFHQATVEI